MSGKRWRKRLRVIVTLLLSIFGLLMGIGAGCADEIIIHASRNPIDAQGAVRNTIGNGADRILEIFVARSTDAAGSPDAYVLEFTGNATRAEQIATYVAG